MRIDRTPDPLAGNSSIPRNTGASLWEVERNLERVLERLRLRGEELGKRPHNSCSIEERRSIVAEVDNEAPDPLHMLIQAPDTPLIVLTYAVTLLSENNNTLYSETIEIAVEPPIKGLKDETLENAVRRAAAAALKSINDPTVDIDYAGYPIWTDESCLYINSDDGDLIQFNDED